MTSLPSTSAADEAHNTADNQTNQPTPLQSSDHIGDVVAGDKVLGDKIEGNKTVINERGPTQEQIRRLWIQRLAEHYRTPTVAPTEADHLQALQAPVSEPAALLRSVRMKIVQGVHDWPEADNVPPDQLVAFTAQTRVALILWPLVDAHILDLSAFFGRALRVMTSPEVVDLIVSVRQQHTKTNSKEEQEKLAFDLAVTLAQPQYTTGVRQLLAYLEDKSNWQTLLAEYTLIVQIGNRSSYPRGIVGKELLQEMAIATGKAIGLGAVVATMTDLTVNRKNALLVLAWEGIAKQMSSSSTPFEKRWVGGGHP